MRRVTVFVMLIVLALSFFLLSGCVPQSPTDTEPMTKTQECKSAACMPAA